MRTPSLVRVGCVGCVQIRWSEIIWASIVRFRFAAVVDVRRDFSASRHDVQAKIV
jgi:hypothetical protein